MSFMSPIACGNKYSRRWFSGKKILAPGELQPGPKAGVLLDHAGQASPRGLDLVVVFPAEGNNIVAFVLTACTAGSQVVGVRDPGGDVQVLQDPGYVFPGRFREWAANTRELRHDLQECKF